MASFLCCEVCGKPCLNPVDNCMCWWREQLSEFIEDEFPKGNKSRGEVLVGLSLFLVWLQKRAKIVLNADRKRARHPKSDN